MGEVFIVQKITHCYNVNGDNIMRAIKVKTVNCGTWILGFINVYRCEHYQSSPHCPELTNIIIIIKDSQGVVKVCNPELWV